MNRSQYQLSKIPQLDDAALAQFAGEVAETIAAVEDSDLNSTTHISNLADELEEVRESRGKFIGLSTGYQSLDDKMGGIEKGSVILIGGETSQGKSALAANLAVKIGSSFNNVLYITLEMTRKQMLDRFDQISEGNALDLDIAIQNHFTINYRNLEPIIDQAILEHGTEVVVIDYLQYLGRGMDEKEVAVMSKKIKQIALTRNIAMLVIVSLRKAANEGRGTKRKWYDIEIEDLMGTAAIGYDADNTIIVSRKDLDNEFQRDRIYVKVLKTRNKATDFSDRFITFIWDNLVIRENSVVDIADRMHQQDVRNGVDADGFMEVK